VRLQPRDRAHRALLPLVVATLVAAALPPVVAAAPANSNADKVNVIVAYSGHPGRADEQAIERLEGKVRHRYGIVNAIAAEVPRGQLKRLAAEAGVTGVEIDGKLTTLDHGPATGDLEYENAWGVEHIGSRAAHLAGINGSGIKVAVIDTGIDYIHDDPLDNPYVVDPEFNGIYAGGWDFFNNDADPMDDNGHGTHVSGILAAEHNGYLVTGVAPGVQLFALKILSADGVGEYSGLIAALDWIVSYNATNAEDIRVVNMSIGSHDVSATLQAAIEATSASGVLLAAASGNIDPLNIWEYLYGCAVVYPAAYPQVLATTFTNENNALTGYSCTGPEVDVASPGDQIASAVPIGPCMLCDPRGYAFLSGTSMAAPHLAGTLALLLDAGLADTGTPGLLDDARSAICSTADVGFGVMTVYGSTPIPTNDPRYPKYFGCGVINADGAVFSVAPPPPPPPNTPPVAVDDTATVSEDVGGPIPVLANDTDADGNLLSLVSVGAASHGTTLANANGTVTYTPSANYNGPDSFTYVVSDGIATDSGSVSVTVSPVNDPPFANDDAASTPYQTAIAVPVLANDTDVDGDALTVASVGAASHGTVTIGPGGSVTYTPAAGYSGPDAFGYTARDPSGATDPATVNITVGAAPPPPSAIHVGDLDRSATKSGTRWNAQVTIGVHTSTEAAVAGAVVTGSWTRGTTSLGTATCTTGSTGRCTVTKSKLPASTTSVTFTVTSVAKSGSTYDPVANHESDGDSTGTSITVAKPA